MLTKKILIACGLLALVSTVAFGTSFAAERQVAHRVVTFTVGYGDATHEPATLQVSLPEDVSNESILMKMPPAEGGGGMSCWASMAACQAATCAPGQCTYTQCSFPCAECDGGVCGTGTQCITCPW